MGAGHVPREVLNESPAFQKPSIQVRDAVESDAPALARLCEQLGYPTHAGDIVPRLRLMATDPHIRVIVAMDGSDVIGLATIHIRQALNHAAPLGQLTLLVVDEAWRGRGVGRALVDATEAWTRGKQCTRLIVTTALRRTDAHAFYEKIGFAHTGRRYAKDFT